jgi:hypothetical protein
MNLPELLQQHFNYTPLQKIDPNTQEVHQLQAPTAAMGQAGIAAILTGLYKFSRSHAGAETIIRGEVSPNWVQTIFAPQHKEVIKRVADYAHHDFVDTEIKLNTIACKAIEIIRNAVSPEYKISDVKELMGNQFTTILLYLPAALQMGELMNDDTLDDRTHKMEGPLSSLMQSIGSGFSGNQKSDQ